MTKITKSHVKQIIETFIVSLLIFFLSLTNCFSSLDYLLKDALYQKPRGISNQIKIIGIDEKTLSSMGPMNTWDRGVYADLLDKLNNSDYMPDVIAFDIIFQGYMNENDERFVASAMSMGNVVTASQYIYSEKPEYADNNLLKYPIESAYYPYEELKNATSYGFTNISQDSDAIVRRFSPYEFYNDEEQKVFSRVIYEKYCSINGITPTDPLTDKYGMTLINYSGKPGEYEEISLIDILDEKVDLRTFKDSIILVGAYAPGLQDNFKIPNEKSDQMYGVEIHANILQSFMQERYSVTANPFVCSLIYALIGAIIYIIFTKSKIWVSSIILAVTIGAELYIGTVLNNKGTSVPLIYLPFMMIISYIYCLALKYLVERIKRRKVVSAFKKYVAPEVVDELSKKNDFKISLGGENRDIAVLFVDIRGFTTMSEALEPEQVVEILNRYLALTATSIFKNKGTLDKFVGDATMAVFNSPFDLDDYVYRAVCAAMDIVAGGDAIEAEFMEKYGKSVGFGVGVNCGPAVVGNVGCDFRMDFTAIGDTVNTAARLEANAKKGQVLISSDVYERIKDRISVEEIGIIPLKGKTNGVFVYSVIDIIKK